VGGAVIGAAAEVVLHHVLARFTRTSGSVHTEHSFDFHKCKGSELGFLSLEPVYTLGGYGCFERKLCLHIQSRRVMSSPSFDIKNADRWNSHLKEKWIKLMT
jgi:hypothetical protein